MTELRRTEHGAWIVLINEDPPLYYTSEAQALTTARATLKLSHDARVYVAHVEYTAP